MNVDTTEPTASDEMLLIDGAIATLAGGGLAREGEIVPVAAGGNGTEAWGPAWGALSINEAGDHCYEADTNGATTTDGVIVKNGVIIYREGDVVDGLTLTGAPIELWMNENGDVAFEWATTGNLDALFLNGHLLAVEGDLVDWDGDGLLDANAVIADLTGGAGQLIGPRGPNGQIEVYFTADIDLDGAGTAPLREGLFHMSVGSAFAGFCFGDGTGTACPCGNNSPSAPATAARARSAWAASSRRRGTASLAADTLVLHGHADAEQLGALLPGHGAGGRGAGGVFGDGLRCAGGTIVRLKPTTNVGGCLAVSRTPAIRASPSRARSPRRARASTRCGTATRRRSARRARST